MKRLWIKIQSPLLAIGIGLGMFLVFGSSLGVLTK